MHYVLLRDDDTNSLTPVECLERLYRPFLARELPVNLATIPHIRPGVRGPDGRTEGYLLNRATVAGAESVPPMNPDLELVQYLRHNRGYHILQHGYDHSLFEFDSADRANIARRLEDGTRLLVTAGFDPPTTFVAPYDRLSRVALREVVRRFRVLSTGWYEWRRLPLAWLPRYALKKWRRHPHWRVNRTFLLSHPGCLLSYHRPYALMFEAVKAAVRRQPVTVLVTHWWEYFRDERADDEFIAVLHATAEWLSQQPDVQVISFKQFTEMSPSSHLHSASRRSSWSTSLEAG